MNLMNLINFHKYQKNEKYVIENKIYYYSQGLYYSYWIMPIGNGFNTYIFTIEFNNKQYEIIVEEQHIINWTIGQQFEENRDAEPHDSIEFNACGKIKETGQFIK